MQKLSTEDPKRGRIVSYVDRPFKTWVTENPCPLPLRFHRRLHDRRRRCNVASVAANRVTLFRLTKEKQPRSSTIRRKQYAKTPRR
jgi:hypothetical protein